jgi:hypothetical protein
MHGAKGEEADEKRLLTLGCCGERTELEEHQDVLKKMETRAVVMAHAEQGGRS